MLDGDYIGNGGNLFKIKDLEGKLTVILYATSVPTIRTPFFSDGDIVISDGEIIMVKENTHYNSSPYTYYKKGLNEGSGMDFMKKDELKELGREISRDLPSCSEVMTKMAMEDLKQTLDSYKDMEERYRGRLVKEEDVTLKVICAYTTFIAGVIAYKDGSFNCKCGE